MPGEPMRVIPVRFQAFLPQLIKKRETERDDTMNALIKIISL